MALPLLREIGGWPILGTNEGGNWREGDFSLTSLIVTINKYSNVPYIYPYVYFDSKDKKRRVLYVSRILRPLVRSGSISGFTCSFLCGFGSKKLGFTL